MTMPIPRASFQSTRNTLEQFYGEMAASPDQVSSRIGQQMCELLLALGEASRATSVWGLTSLSRLWLLARDEPSADWLVGIQAVPSGGYRVYRPRDPADDSDGSLFGLAPDVTTAASLVLAAMTASGGWKM